MCRAVPLVVATLRRIPSGDRPSPAVPSSTDFVGLASDSDLERPWRVAGPSS